MTIDFPTTADIDAEMKKLEEQAQKSKVEHEKSIKPFNDEWERQRGRR